MQAENEFRAPEPCTRSLLVLDTRTCRQYAKKYYCLRVMSFISCNKPTEPSTEIRRVGQRARDETQLNPRKRRGHRPLFGDTILVND